MGASAWTVFDAAKNFIGTGSLPLLTGIHRMSLHTSACSAEISGAITSWASIGNEISATGGYVRKTLASRTWTAGTSAGVQKFDFTDPVFTASGSILKSIRYAVVMASVSAGGGLPLCYAALSTSSFSVTSGNTLTVQLATTGCFILA